MIFNDPYMGWGRFRQDPKLVLYWYFHRVTSSWRGIPSFIIIGVPKGGTTSLFNYLVQHPDVRPPFRKEIRFFDFNYAEGFFWYQAHFPLQIKLKREIITGEASPYYFSHPLAAERIAQRLPSIKLIVLLRNPAERAFSHYHHMLRVKHEHLSFERAIEEEPKRLEGEEEQIIADVHHPLANFIRFTYLTQGLYCKHLKRWFNFFPRKQILILKSEDLSLNPSALYKETLAFLGLRAWEPKEFRMYNQGHYDEMLPTTRERLNEFFKPYNEQLYTLLGKDLGWVE